MLAHLQIGKDPFTRLTTFARARADPVALAQPQVKGNGLG